MDPRELIALVTARVQRFHQAPGGIPNLTAEDIAHALGLIQHSEARLFARVKYAHQFEYAEGVALSIRRKTMLEKLDNNWRISRKEFLLDMAYMILAEAIDPHLCPDCAGRGQGIVDNLVVICSSCGGTGEKKEIRDVDRARLLGVSKSNWHNNWADRYEDARRDTVLLWDDLFAGALKKRLAG